MTGPAERFEFEYEFPFDEFQRRACAALADGSSVLVAAPTGAGKTVVGEFAAWLALQQGGKTFYTTPIKALSNQKYWDFVALHGADKVGLLTGDNSINGEAPLIVMTTEVLRNMLYEDSPTLRGLRFVVLDEVHYLQDRYRGAVWEEVLIHLPIDVLVSSLSATVSNAEEFAEWLQTIRGRTEVIIEERRPVEIRHWYFGGDQLIPMFVAAPSGQVAPNPKGREFDRRSRKPPGADRPGRGGRRPRPPRRRTPFRSDVVERLAAEDMLPAIYFIFSRRGCDEAVRQCIREHVRLTSPAERSQIAARAEERVADLPDDELDVLGYHQWLEGLRNGIAAHHAGMIPPFKETVEELFTSGLVKVVFATETLALGINMPARSVVIENLTKFTGERHELMSPGQYTQLSGRAGRRGIDDLGNCVVLVQRFTPFDTITRLASTRTYPLQSSFQPSYNMAVNLVRNYEPHDAEHLVNSSFAQFQTDRDVVRLERTRERTEGYLASYRERMRCDRGDFAEYCALLDGLRRAEQGDVDTSSGRTGRVADAMVKLRPGDVIDVVGGRRRGRYAVVDVPGRTADRQPRVLAVSESKSMVKFSPSDFNDPPRSLGRLTLPRNFTARDARARRHIARQLTSFQPGGSPRSAARDGEPEQLRALRAEVEAHPCHGCPDRGRHLHYAERAARLEKDLGGQDRRINRRTGTLSRRFKRVLEVLESLDYVVDWNLTDKGRVLGRVYNESDLLVVEALHRAVFDGLDAPQVAAVCSTLVYEARGPEAPPPPEMPTARVKDRCARLMRLWRDIHAHEEERGLELTREPDPGFVMRAYLWADGAALDEVLGPDDAPGDFVRSTKQLVDLLRQLVEVAPSDALADVFDDAVERLQRGVVAFSSLGV